MVIAVKLSWVGHDLAAMGGEADLMNMLNHIPAPRVAVFIDGDNVTCKLIAALRAQAEHLGRIDTVRVYADEDHVAQWRETPGVTLAPMASGKNASDIALCLDALEMALSGDIGTFVIASADQGFAHLAQRLRSHGKWVVGASGVQPSPFFQSSCNEFRHLRVALDDMPAQELHSKIMGVLGASPVEPIPLDEFGQKMRQVGVTTADLPKAKWSTFLADHPDRYILSDRGVQQRVNLTGQQWLYRHANHWGRRQ